MLSKTNKDYGKCHKDYYLINSRSFCNTPVTEKVTYLHKGIDVTRRSEGSGLKRHIALNMIQLSTLKSCKCESLSSYLEAHFLLAPPKRYKLQRQIGKRQYSWQMVFQCSWNANEREFGWNLKCHDILLNVWRLNKAYSQVASTGFLLGKELNVQWGCESKKLSRWDVKLCCVLLYRTLWFLQQQSRGWFHVKSEYIGENISSICSFLGNDVLS